MILNNASNIKIGTSSAREIWNGSNLIWSNVPIEFQPSLWMDASDSSSVVLNGSTVSQWKDKSPNSWHFTQATAANQPTYNINKLTFTGTQFLSNLNTGAKQIFKNKLKGTIICVVKYASITSGRTCITFSPSASNLNRFILHAGSISSSYPSINYGAGGRRLDTDSFRDIGSSFFTANSTIIQIAEADWGDSNLFQYINGTLNGSDLNFQTAGNTSNTDSGAVTLGAVGNASFGMVGDIFEVFVFDKILSTFDRQRIEGYLAHKWKLTDNLPIGHPYKI